mmetsp:Transcript_13043/g.15728  ORF Transcript_13043/g.15728 Transcript_13043/m.15728 type:complete len:163 (-) Transcript_13043:799-1287(-)
MTGATRETEWNQKVERVNQAIEAGEEVDLSFDVHFLDEVQGAMKDEDNSNFYKWSAAPLTGPLEESKPHWWGQEANEDEKRTEEPCWMDPGTFYAKWERLYDRDTEAYEKFELLLSKVTGNINTITYTRNYNEGYTSFNNMVLKAEHRGYLLTYSSAGYARW